MDIVLHAELHGKLALDADDAERREDVLTSTVFGVLFLADAWDVATAWLSRARAIGHENELVPVRAGSEQYWFWPRLENAEPDVVVRVGNFLVVVEAKYHSGKSGKDSPTAPALNDREDAKDQLVREWRACSPHAATWAYPEALRNAIDSCDRALVYLVQRSRLTRERRAVEQSLKQEPDARIYILTWEDLDEALATAVGGPWIGELREYLHRKRLTAFRGFSLAVEPTRADVGFRSWRYVHARAEVQLRSSFAVDALHSVEQLSQWRRQPPSGVRLGWPRITPPSSLERLSRLAVHPSQLARPGEP